MRMASMRVTRQCSVCNQHTSYNHMHCCAEGLALQCLSLLSVETVNGQSKKLAFLTAASCSRKMDLKHLNKGQKSLYPIKGGGNGGGGGGGLGGHS